MKDITDLMKNQINDIKSELSSQFNSAYYSLPAELLQAVKDELSESLDWKQRTFYYRLSGFAPVKKIEKPYIEQIFQKYGIQVFKQTA